MAMCQEDYKMIDLTSYPNGFGFFIVLAIVGLIALVIGLIILNYSKDKTI